MARTYYFSDKLTRRSLCAKVWHKTYPICVTLHFRDWLGAASLRHRKRAAKTVLLCEQKPFPVWFSRRRKSYPVKCEHILSYDMSSSMLSINLLCIYILSGTVRAANSGDRTIHQVLAYKWLNTKSGRGRLQELVVFLQGFDWKDCGD